MPIPINESSSFETYELDETLSQYVKATNLKIEIEKIFKETTSNTITLMPPVGRRIRSILNYTSKINEDEIIIITNNNQLYIQFSIYVYLTAELDDGSVKLLTTNTTAEALLGPENTVEVIPSTITLPSIEPTNIQTAEDNTWASCNLNIGAFNCSIIEERNVKLIVKTNK